MQRAPLPRLLPLLSRSSLPTARTMSSSSDAASFGTEHIARGVGRLSQHVLERGEGSYVWTDDGTRLLDITSGIGVVNLGHCHPKVTAAAAAQCGKIVHAQVNIGFSAPYVEMVKRLLPKLPDPSLNAVFLWNSGAEAVEASVKLARAVTKKQNIIVMQGSYHGRTYGTMAMTRSKTIYAEGYGPHMPGVIVTPFPYYSQFGLPQSTPEQQLVDMSLAQLRLVLQQQSAPSDTAAIILEPVMGEGGYVPAPAAYLHGLREICDEHNILLIADEVQSGFGRTGTFWAVQDSGVRPDILVFAKGVANGFPLSGIASRKELMDMQKPGSMGGTYAGNAVACAAASAVIQAFDEERILENVAARSRQLTTFLEGLRKTKAGALIQDVRGRGLMIGVQFARTPTTSESSNRTTSASASNAKAKAKAASQIAPQVVAECLKRDMLILATSVFDVIRFIPPLTISEGEMDACCRIFGQALEAVAKEL